MTIKTGNRYYVAMAPTVFENRYHFATNRANNKSTNMRYFLVVVLVTVIVQHSIYTMLSNRAAVSARPRSDSEHTDSINDRTIHKRDTKTLEKDNSFTSNVKGNVCHERIKWKRSAILPEVTSDMDYWTYDRPTKCPYINIDDISDRQIHLKLSLTCEIGGISLKWTDDTQDVFSTKFGDECVENYISSCCHGTSRVPNVVHYVWYSRGELSFVGFMSLLSVVRFVNPCLIVFHGDGLPYGRYWDFIRTMTPNIIHLSRERPKTVFGQKIFFDEHSGDIMRIEALLKYGGIYLDTDTVLVKPIDQLRKYKSVMSTQHFKLGSAFILAEPNSTFLQKWMDGYRYKYNKFDYTYNAMTYPLKIALKFSDLIHIESGTISRPKDMYRNKLYQHRYMTYNWSKIYGVHLFSRIYGGPLNEKTIRRLPSTCGSILRHVLYGNKELCKTV